MLSHLSEGMKVTQPCSTLCEPTHPIDYTSMDFSRPRYWIEQPFPSPGDLPHPWIERRSSALQADSLPTELSEKSCPSLQPYGLWPTRFLYPWGLSRKELWGELPCPSPGNLPDPGIKIVSLTSPALAGRSFTTSTTWEAQIIGYALKILLIPSRTTHKWS